MSKPEQGLILTAEIFLMAAEMATWAEVENLVKVGTHVNLDPVDLLVGLKSQRKQTIEILTAVLVAREASVAAEALIQMVIAQADGANAIRGRNALIGLGADCAEAILPHLTEKNWQVRQYLAQCLGLYQVPQLVQVLEAMHKCDKSSKVRETASQAIQYTLGQVPLSECNLLPSPDDRELRIGTVSEGF